MNCKLVINSSFLYAYKKLSYFMNININMFKFSIQIRSRDPYKIY